MKARFQDVHNVRAFHIEEALVVQYMHCVGIIAEAVRPKGKESARQQSEVLLLQQGIYHAAVCIQHLPLHSASMGRCSIQEPS